jgi:hypothetical protein
MPGTAGRTLVNFAGTKVRSAGKLIGCRAIAQRQAFRQRVGTRRCRDAGTVGIKGSTKPAVLSGVKFVNPFPREIGS